MSEADLVAIRCEIIDELHDELEAMSWQRMVLLACSFAWHAGKLQPRGMACAYFNAKAAFEHFSKQEVDEVPK